MEPAGMVHALETIHDLLATDGVLIDMRPKGIPAAFWGHRGERSALLGYIDETDGFIEYRQAASALEQAIDKKWFRLQDSGEYDFIIHAGSFEELRSYLAVEWTDAVIPAEVPSRAAAMQADRITLKDFIHIGVLLPL